MASVFTPLRHQLAQIVPLMFNVVAFLPDVVASHVEPSQAECGAAQMCSMIKEPPSQEAASRIDAHQ